jgi:hypothetical protein
MTELWNNFIQVDKWREKIVAYEIILAFFVSVIQFSSLLPVKG